MVASLAFRGRLANLLLVPPKMCLPPGGPPPWEPAPHILGVHAVDSPRSGRWSRSHIFGGTRRGPAAIEFATTPVHLQQRSPAPRHPPPGKERHGRRPDSSGEDRPALRRRPCPRTGGARRRLPLHQARARDDPRQHGRGDPQVREHRRLAHGEPPAAGLHPGPQRPGQQREEPRQVRRHPRLRGPPRRGLLPRGARHRPPDHVRGGLRLARHAGGGLG